VLQKGSLEGVIRRCKHGATTGACRGGVAAGDLKGPIIFMFFQEKSPSELNNGSRPVFYHKMAVVDFTDAAKEIKFSVPGIPPGEWLIYVLLDDADDWKVQNPLPNKGDLVGFVNAVKVTSGQATTQDFYLLDQY
tara:strand:+ start:1035 stop:1439 length:405 start_codon:yes stop_codon:yes gene_type:complete